MRMFTRVGTLSSARECMLPVHNKTEQRNEPRLINAILTIEVHLHIYYGLQGVGVFIGGVGREWHTDCVWGLLR